MGRRPFRFLGFADPEDNSMRRSFWFSTLALYIVLCSCGGQWPAAAEERGMADIFITVADQDQERWLVPGQRAQVRLAENPTTGYQWRIETFDPEVLSASGSEFEPSPGGRLGGGGWRIFVFTALAPGHTTVRLRYRRPWEPASQEDKAFCFGIHVQTKAKS
jgi:predicted secreted protein